MLVLKRREGEAIAIGQGIKITVLEIKGRQVKLGIEAPAEIQVHRMEVYQKIQEENLQALQGADVLEEILIEEG